MSDVFDLLADGSRLIALERYQKDVEGVVSDLVGFPVSVKFDVHRPEANGDRLGLAAERLGWRKNEKEGHYWYNSPKSENVACGVTVHCHRKETVNVEDLPF